jgi:hypothetical protein
MTSQRTREDLEHIKLLAIFHYVVGGLFGLAGCVPIIHLTVGVLMVTESPKMTGGPPVAAFGVFFIAIATFFILLFWSVAVCTILAGRYLHAQQHYLFCMVMAAILCAFMPFGTVLGVFTLIVLLRPSVKSLFQAQDALPVQE